MSKALITGITGQDGAYLSSLLLGKGYDVFGLVQPGANVPDAVLPPLAGVELLTGDLLDDESVRRALHASRPDEVYNLAGLSSVAQSWKEPVLTAEVNGLAVLRLLETIRSYSKETARFPRLLQASSAEMFGTPVNTPQDEATPLRPHNPYGVAKAFAHQSVGAYRRGHDMFASTVILYNHESPIRPPMFVSRKITSAVAAIAFGRSEELVLGDVEARRDWGFAGDYVEAMWLALQAEQPDDFVIATGESHSVGEFAAAAFRSAGIDEWQRFVSSDRSFERPIESPILLGDASRARRVLGWRPAMTFEELVHEMVQHDLRLESELP